MMGPNFLKLLNDDRASSLGDFLRGWFASHGQQCRRRRCTFCDEIETAVMTWADRQAVSR